MANRLRKLLARLDDGTAAVSGFVVLAMVFVIAANTVLRYGFNTSWTFVEEYTAYGLVVMTFLPLAWTLKEKGHISIELLVNKLSLRTAARLNALTGAISAVVVVVMLVYGWQLMAQNYQRGVNAATYTMTPLWIPQAFIVAGLALFAIEIVAYVGALLSGDARGGEAKSGKEEKPDG